MKIHTEHFTLVEQPIRPSSWMEQRRLFLRHALKNSLNTVVPLDNTTLAYNSLRMLTSMFTLLEKEVSWIPHWLLLRAPSWLDVRELPTLSCPGVNTRAYHPQWFLHAFWESALLRCSEGGDGSHVPEVLAGNHAFNDFQLEISRAEAHARSENPFGPSNVVFPPMSPASNA